MRHKAGQLDSLKDLDIHELEAQRLATQRQIDELTEVYLQQKEAANPGHGKMMRRQMGYNKGARDQRSQSIGAIGESRRSSGRSDLSEDDVA